MRDRRRAPVKGVQYGSDNEQLNYYAPVTQYLFSGEFERLSDVRFNPPLARELDLARFTGREWLIRRVDEFIAERPRGYVIIQAEAGVGKSTLAAHLAGKRQWPCHFTQLSGGRAPEAARKNLAAQLITQWGLQQEWAPEEVLPVASWRSDWFSQLLEAAARKRDRQASDQEHREPIVIVVDGLDEAEPEAAGGRGLPLGLPKILPDGVYVVATSRFGIDRALHAVRNPAEWLQIEVEGTDNLDDMRRFIDNATSPDDGDARLVTMLHADGVDIGWFRAHVAQACAGVWIYLKYVLDEIRDGTRNPRSVGDLPGDLGGFYAEQVERWRGAAEDEAAQRRWEQVRLPLLGVLGAARAPLTVAELAGFAAVPSPEAARVFVEESARAFLSCRDDGPTEAPRYALRHQSLRDLFTGRIPPRPDLESPARMLTAQVQAAHRQITSALLPPGEPGERDWQVAGPYARRHLATHAAACGYLDALASDPGFLLTADPGAVLAQRANLRTPGGRRALAAFDLGLHDWEAATPAARLGHLAANAARVHAPALSAACTIAGSEWPVRWAAWTGQGHRRLADHDDPVNAVAIGRAGDRDIIVSGSDDGTVRVWDAVTGDPAGAPLAGHDGPVNAVAVGRAGDRDIIVSGSDDGTVQVWDAVTGDPPGAWLADHDGRVNAVAIGRAGDRDIVVSGSDDGTLRVWDAVTGDLLADHESWVNAVAVGRAGDRDIIVSGSDDGTVRVWDAVTGDPAGDPLAGHDNLVNAVAVGRAGDRDIIVSGSDDGTVRVWDALTGDPPGTWLAGHHGPVNAVAIGRAGDRDIIVSGSDDGTVRVWDAVTGDPAGAPLADNDGPVRAVAIGRPGDQDIIVSGSDDGTVRVWDALTGDPPGTWLAGHHGPVNAVAIGRAGDRDVIVSGSDDGTVRVWDAVTGDPFDGPLADVELRVNAVAIGRAGDRDVIVSDPGDGTVRVWDAVTGYPAGDPLADHDGPIRAVAIGRAGDRDVIVSGSDDGTVRVWDAVTGHPAGDPLADHDGPIRAVAIGRAGDRDVIVSGSDDGTVRVWDAVTGHPAGDPLADHDGPIRAVAIGRAGDRDVIVSGSDDGTVRVWDAVTGHPAGDPLADHDGPIRAVAIGRAGDRDVIVSGSDDGTVRVWDAVTGHPADAPLAGHDGRVNAVAIGRAGDRDVIVSGSDDRTVLMRQHRPRRQARQVP